MEPRLLLNAVIRPTLTWLAEEVQIPRSVEAETLLLAIALQESGITDRIQGRGDEGPARGFWQFERIGVLDVMQRRTRDMERVCKELVIGCVTDTVWRDLAWNDMLACSVARLTLRLDRQQLPAASLGSEDAAWAYYLRNWRPGKPHRDRWTKNWPLAVSTAAA